MKPRETDLKQKGFVHLHVHSHMSMLDGAATIKDIVDEACRLKMPAIAITDHGNLFAASEFYEYARHRGIKPIIGIEAYLTPSNHAEFNRTTPLYHLILLARNEIGYMNLYKLSSLAYTEGFYYRPRIDFDQLKMHSAGLIALSSCISGEVARKLLDEDEEGAVAAIKKYQRIFGKANFYVEIQNHGIPEQLKILNHLAKVARLCDAPIVATNDTHYVKSEDWLTQDLLMCVRTKSLFEDKHRFKFSSKEFYLKSAQEMKSLFCDYPDAIENTVRIAARCNLTVKSFRLPLCGKQLAEAKDFAEKADKLCYNRLCNMVLTGRLQKIYRERLKKELVVTEEMGCREYLMLLSDLKKHIEQEGFIIEVFNKVWTGSLIAYLLGLSNTDPVKQGLDAARLSKNENGDPFAVTIRADQLGKFAVTQYLVKKHGIRKTANIIKFKHLSSRSSIRAIGRILGVGADVTGKISKTVPARSRLQLKECIKVVPELNKMFCKGTSLQKKILRLALKINGFCLHSAVNPHQLLISFENIDELLPVMLDHRSNILVTQFKKNDLKAYPFVAVLFQNYVPAKIHDDNQKMMDDIQILMTGKPC